MSYAEWAKVSESELRGLNLVWKFCMNHGLIGVPDSEKSQKNVLFFEFARKGSAAIPSPNLQAALILVEQLYSIVFDSKLKVSGHWNYLGNEKNRSQYTEYLRTIYWQNQTNEDLVHAANSAEYLDSPHLILGNTTFLQNTLLYSPLDMLDAAGLELVTNLTSRFGKLTFNPLFIPAITDTIVLQFLIEGALTITISVAKSAEFGLACHIEYELGFNERTA